MRCLNIFCLLFLALMTGCAAFHTQPQFAFNGNARNSWIVDRKPQYGDGERDGCIVMSEMKVQLRQDAPGHYSGLIRDVEEIETLMFVTMVVNPGTSSAQEFTSDQGGRFSFQFPEKIRQIAFDGIVFRKILVNLR